MTVDDAVATFRQKYPHSTEEHVRLYAAAVAEELRRLAAGEKPPVEPDIPMPRITVPERAPPPVVEEDVPEERVTTYTARPGRYVAKNFNVDDVPPEVPSAATDSEMKDILLGRYGFSAGLTEDQRRRLLTCDMSEEDMLAMLVGAPNAQEFKALE